MVTEITGLGHFKSTLEQTEDPVVVLFHGDFSDTAVKMKENFDSAASHSDCADGCVLASVDVGKVKDIHKDMRVHTVPVMVVFRKEKESERLMGVQTIDAIKKAVQGAKRDFTSQSGEDKPKFPPVTVYSTPTCGFCTKIKNHLNSHNVPFKDIDISRDTKAGEDLVKKTGQQGVPQTFIGSQFVVGFDQPKIDKLLGLQ